MYWIKKGPMTGEKQIPSIDFAIYLRKSDVSENSKAYHGWLLRKWVHERYIKVY